MQRCIMLCGAAVLAAFAAGPAHAISYFMTGESAGNPESALIGVHVDSGDVGESFEIDWLVDPHATGGEEVSGTSLWTIESYSDDQILLTITVENTSVLTDMLSNSAIMSLAVGVDPDATALLTSGDVFDTVSAGNGPNQTFPGGFQGIDVCVFASSCSGGPISEGLQAGDTDTFQLLLTASDEGGFVDGMDLLFFGAKFQTAVGSFEPGGQPIPEPQSAMLLLLGVWVVRRSVRRR